MNVIATTALMREREFAIQAHCHSLSEHVPELQTPSLSSVPSSQSHSSSSIHDSGIHRPLSHSQSPFVHDPDSGVVGSGPWLQTPSLSSLPSSQSHSLSFTHDSERMHWPLSHSHCPIKHDPDSGVVGSGPEGPGFIGECSFIHPGCWAMWLEKSIILHLDQPTPSSM